MNPITPMVDSEIFDSVRMNMIWLRLKGECGVFYVTCTEFYLWVISICKRAVFFPMSALNVG